MINADLSLHTLLTAMRDAGCGDPHPVLAGGLRYVPPSAETHVNREAFEELSEYGFTQGNGFTPEFDDLLHRLDNPRCYAYARDEAGQIGILAAPGVTVVCRGDRVTLETKDSHPADALVAKLPPHRPAPIKPFTLSQEDFKGPQDVSDVFDDAPARSREAQELDALFQRRHLGLGQLYAETNTVSYLDLDEGRVGIALENGYISVVPGDHRQLSHKLKAATSP
ncbi:ESX secretion-associated protein EspG [Amycolatopsis sp. NPDC098790]|uniref:ESX secretion-associated protein EspG n=1 Tax=Amycolatopsis sp. NPDC098790 TaxID=3363939 RepID=UPI00382970DF